MKLFLRNREVSIMGEVMMHIPVGETEQKIKINKLIELDGKVYQCCIVDFQNKAMLLDPVIIKEDLQPDETTTNESWNCPFCCYEDEESHELEKSSDDYECPVCGAITEYEVEYLPRFTVKLKKKPDVSKIIVN